MRNLIITYCLISISLGLQAAEKMEVFLVDHGIHTGIVLHRGDILLGEFEPSENFREEFLEFSIGEDPFFREKEHSKLGMIRALFWPSSNLMRIHPFNGKPIKYYKDKPGIAKLLVDHKQWKQILNYIKDSFESFDTIEVQEDKQRYFYKGVGNYHIFNNCNDWSSRAFAGIGVKTGLFARFSSEKLFKEIQAQAADSSYNKTGNEKFMKYLE